MRTRELVAAARGFLFVKNPGLTAVVFAALQEFAETRVAAAGETGARSRSAERNASQPRGAEWAFPAARVGVEKDCFLRQPL